MKKMTYLLNLTLLVVCSQFAFADGSGNQAAQENKEYNYLPPSILLQNKITPIYKSYQGWNSSTSGISKWSDLPLKAQYYISEIERLIGTKISTISTGPERKETINR